MACKDKKGLDDARLFRRVSEAHGGGFVPTGAGGYTQNVFAYTLSISCNHCDDSICVRNCPTTATRKRAEDGVVVSAPPAASVPSFAGASRPPRRQRPHDNRSCSFRLNKAEPTSLPWGRWARRSR